MRDIINMMAEMVNNAHDLLIVIFNNLGFDLTDKQLHFWIIGFFGIITFSLVYVAFKWIEKLKWNITILSFIYTFTVMVVLVFAIEIQQAITNRGNMEFTDAVIGLWGFIVLFICYIAIGLVIYLVHHLIKDRKY